MSTETLRAVVRSPGGPDAIEWTREALPPPGADEVSLRQTAVGVDFIDTQIRSGAMPMSGPTGLGFSAAGEVIGLGAGVHGLSVGDRVVYSWPQAGAYATHRNVPAERVHRLGDQKLDPASAAGLIFRGLTAWYLCRRLRPIGAGEWVLVHAAAGGVGQILCQWLKHLGARVIATTGTASKLDAVRALGVDHALVLGPDTAAEVSDLTGGGGCAVVFDSVGKDSWPVSLDCAARFGLVVSFGWASGDFDTVSLSDLRARGSLFVTRPTIAHYTARAEDVQQGAAELFGLLSNGALRLHDIQRYPLEDAARAHGDLVARKTTGSVVLVP